MADNVTVSAGSGTTIAADEVNDGSLGSCKVQFIKIMDGSLNGTTKAGVGTNGLVVDPSGVVLTVNSHNVTNAGTFAVQSTSNVVSATFVKNTVDFTASQTAQTIWTPTSGKKFVITDMVCSVTSTGAGTLTLFDATDTTGNRIAKVYLANNGGFVTNYSKPFASSTADNVLKYTTGSGCVGSITISGYEI